MDFLIDIYPYASALLPTIGVAFLFYWIIKYMIEADRSERKALAQWRKEHPDADTPREAPGPRGASSVGDDSRA